MKKDIVIIGPTDSELEVAFKEENEAVLAFAKICREETKMQTRKIAARQRLQSAREEKRSMLSELMSL